MATVIRPEISEKNKYWIDKHRHYELKHFCLQYHSWERAYADLDGLNKQEANVTGSRTNIHNDPTCKCVDMRIVYLNRMDLVRRIAHEADPALATYIFKAVTEGLSYTYLKSKLRIPCGKDMYYDRYRRFFWLLSNARK